jgi:protoporphyrinogen oxidase
MASVSQAPRVQSARPLRIAIVGGGVAGLGCAYFLSGRGHAIEVFEQAPFLGGLAGSFDFDGMEVEKYYHFVCRDDTDLVRILDELGIGDELEWQTGRMSFFYRGKLYPFGTPLDLLRFTPLSFLGRLRLGLNVAWSRSARSWQRYESVTAHDWLVARLGRRAYEVVWEPLLKIKFGRYSEDISASWAWHRIHRVARSRAHVLARERLGFLKRGTSILVNALLERLRREGVGLHPSASVESIAVERNAVTGITAGGRFLPCDVLISTVPLPILAQLLPSAAGEQIPELSNIEYLAVVCLVLKLRRPITDAFWINVNDPRVPFNGFIEYTNLNARPDAGEPHIVYVPFYLPPGHARYTQPDADLYQECLAGLRIVHPELKEDWVLGYRVFRDRYAQAICTVNFAQRIPPIRSAVRGLLMTDSTQLYPSDRTISGMIGQARRVAEIVEGMGQR